MPQTKARVLFVNAPQEGRDFGSIKIDSPAIRIGVHSSKLSGFERGKVYDIEYRTNGQYHNLVSYRQVRDQAPVADRQQGGQTGGTYSPPEKSPQDQLSIFVTGVVGRAMQSGKFATNDIPSLTKTAAGAYEIYVKKQPIPRTPAPQADRGGPGGYDDGYMDDSGGVGPRDDIPFDDIPFDR